MHHGIPSTGSQRSADSAHPTGSTDRYHRLRNELEELSADLDTAAKDTSKANTVAKARTLVPHHCKHAIWSLQH
jgi:hypothetical protein